MEKLKVIFKEAGASAADYAKLEELYAIKQAKAIFEANRPRRELEIQLMEAQGRSIEALAASRQLELESMDESLRGIQRLIFAQQDLSAANEAVAAAETRVADALREQRQRDVDVMRGQIDGLDAVIAARETAQEALRQAYETEVSRIRDEIGQREANIASLESSFTEQASVFEGTINQFRTFAQSVREFGSTIIPLNGTGRESLATLQKRFAQIAALAAGGNITAMGQFTEIGGALRDAIIANAPNRTTMLRQLLELQAQTDAVVAGADTQATIAEQQLAAAKTQNDLLIGVERTAIAQFEAQIKDTAALVGQFIELNAQTVSVKDAINTLLTAEQAAISAETQKASLLAQIDALMLLDETVIGLEDAERELANAQARRDELLMEINRSGFASVANAIGGVGSASSAAASAALAAAASIPIVPTAPILPDLSNVIPFPNQPIMGGGSNSIFGNFDGLSIPQNFNGGGGREFGLDNHVQLFANGGIHSGGLRVVGENGPELEATGPSRIYNSNQLGDMLGERATAAEVKALRDELKLAMYQIAKNTGKSYDIINRWNGDGLPPERNVG